MRQKTEYIQVGDRMQDVENRKLKAESGSGRRSRTKERRKYVEVKKLD